MACGLMKVIKEWISPLPDRSLPALQIRMELLKVLMGVSINLQRPGARHLSLDPHCVCPPLQLPTLSARLLKDSGIAHAVVFLQKHPKETQENKDLIHQLIRKNCTRQPKRDKRKQRSVQPCALTVFPFLCADKWMRELFGASTNYQKILKEQRERRNLQPQRQLLRFPYQF